MPQIAGYVRVSTDEQTLERQMNSISEYAQREFDASLNDLEIYRDKESGTSTSREAYLEMVQAVEDGEHDTVAVHDITRLARSLRDLEETVERFVDEGCSVHFVDDRLSFSGDDTPQDRLMLQMLGSFAEFEAAILRRRTRQGIAARQAEEDYHHGRPPFGYDKENGELYPNEDFELICSTLSRVAKDNLSKRKAADKLDTTRTTINRCLERPELYHLED